MLHISVEFHRDVPAIARLAERIAGEELGVVALVVAVPVRAVAMTVDTDGVEIVDRLTCDGRRRVPAVGIVGRVGDAVFTGGEVAGAELCSDGRGCGTGLTERDRRAVEGRRLCEEASG